MPPGEPKTNNGRRCRWSDNRSAYLHAPAGRTQPLSSVFDRPFENSSVEPAPNQDARRTQEDLFAQSLPENAQCYLSETCFNAAAIPAPTDSGHPTPQKRIKNTLWAA